MKKMLLAIVVLAVVCANGCEKKKVESKQPDLLLAKKLKYMGTEVNLTIAIPDDMTQDKAREAKDAALAVIGEAEQQTSKYIETSDVSKLNKAKGKSVKVGEHTLAVIEMALDVSKKTDGAFDITVEPLVDFWKDMAEMSVEEFEKLTADNDKLLNKKIAAIKKTVGYKNVVFVKYDEVKDGKHGTVTLKNGAKIDLGGIAKGYAVDKAVEALEKAGIKAGFVEAGGDLRVFGDFPSSKGWPVSVRHYAGKNKTMERISLQNKALATSGEYERGFTIDETRYSHIINTTTDWPVMNRCSVSVVAPDCATADALATAISVLGPGKGQEIIRMHYAECDFLVVWPTKGWVEETKK